MNDILDADAWADYWSADGATAGGCLPAGLKRIADIQRQVWTRAAAALSRGDRVLDLATGDGVVLGYFRSARTDLKLVGVDSAGRLPPSPAGIELHHGVAMEALPLPDRSVQLVTSQFGFEYGDRQAIAAEMKRVVAPQGRYTMIVHHSESPVVAHNRARAVALRWAVDESAVLEKGRALSRARSAFPLDTPHFFRQAVEQARRLHPQQAVAAEFSLAVLQIAEAGRERPMRQSIELLDRLERRGRAELARIDALCRAAVAPAEIDRLVDALIGAGLKSEPVATLTEDARSAPFAWLVQGSAGS